jgi:hypothetical protein
MHRRRAKTHLIQDLRGHRPPPAAVGRYYPAILGEATATGPASDTCKCELAISRFQL